MIFWLIWVGVVGFIISPPIDNYLDANMMRHMTIQIPSLIFMGYFASRRLTGIHLSDINPYGLTGIIFFIGSLSFWMIPHSLDETILSNWIDMLMHVNMILAGFFLGKSIRLMPFVLRTAVSIYFIGMLLSASIIYLNYFSLLCASYTLEQQKETGLMLFWLSIGLILWLIVWSARSLNKPGGLCIQSGENRS
ncbi:MAG: hypothetical protein IEMM0008_0487 [bacterium]|nr:MAG: hypothetical protein IEMM0008_0487 [bacterium]